MECMAERRPLKGKLLIASPVIADPNFARTVILVTEHGPEGAMGLVLNRRAESTVEQVVPDLDWIAEPGDRVHVGGPVAATSVIVLAEFEDPGEAALIIDGDLGFVPASADDRDALVAALRRRRVFAGHAGWGPGQLEAELEEDSWIVGPALPDDVFADEPEELWATALRRKGKEYALLATMPPDPSLN
jgi:putative transcriptional regulator